MRAEERWEAGQEQREKDAKNWETEEDRREKDVKKREAEEEQREKDVKNWEAEEERREKNVENWEEKRRKKRKERYRLTGSTAAKILVFFMLIISALAAAISAVGIYVCAEMGLYSGSPDGRSILLEVLRGDSIRYAHAVIDYLEAGYAENAEAFMAETNAEVQLVLAEEKYSLDGSQVTWQTGEVGSDWLSTDAVYTVFTELKNGGSGVIRLNIREDAEYILRVCYDPQFPVEDSVRQKFLFVQNLYQFRFVIIGILAGCVLLCIGSFLFLLCAAGHRNGREGIVPSVFTNMHFDVFTAGMGFLMGGLLYLGVTVEFGENLLDLVWYAVVLLTEGILTMLYLMEFAIRLKLGKWWRNTLIYAILRGLWRGVKSLCRGFWRLLCGIPLVMTTLIVFLGVCILEFIGILFFVEAEGAVLWLLEKAVLLPCVLYIALTCKKLQAASEAMAGGQENYVVDTSHMFGALKEHGENLNSLSQGITKAVAERMKSEHLKTELITNVSHDLKTPLTSIINYADLICEEKPENPRIAEYAEVLLRQSRRLKKLLEDLLEASKATTGNLEVNLEPCEVGVLLSQAVGEYQQRMEEKGLELHAAQPEQGVRIMADGRHLWRIFDNLLNNICKYAQENSRVYLSVAQKENKVQIIFRNMSKYALDISAEELEERFVRGDKSRHMEGNGLGLSIAKSLTELQKGKMDIVIDGDLFKVILEFEILS